MRSDELYIFLGPIPANQDISLCFQVLLKITCTLGEALYLIWLPVIRVATAGALRAFLGTA